MTYKIEVKCEKCGKIALGKDDLEKYFGWRKISDKKTIPQAWCRDCRVNYNF